MATLDVETVTVCGQPVAVRRRGSGPRVVYLHDEFAQTASPLPDHLAGTGFEVLVPDLPGFGMTPRPPWVDAIDDAAYFLADVVDALGDGSADVALVGAGLGGWLALEAAVRSPHLVDRLVLVAAPGLEVPGHAPTDHFVVADDERPALLVEDPAAFPQLDEEARIRGEIMTARLVWQPRYVSPRLTYRLHRVRAPALVLWGANDRFLSPGYGAAVADALLGGRLQVIAGCGHLPGSERPAETAAAIAAFLMNPGSAASPEPEASA